MAKPYQHATPICLILSFLAVIGIFWGLNTSNPLIAVLFLLPTVLYEVYRTEGASTKLASWGLLTVYILEIIFIVGNVSFDLAGFLDTEQQYIGGHVVPLGDIKIVGPTIMAILSIILFKNTRGRYTRWLAITIFITSFAIVYILKSNHFHPITKTWS